MVTISAPFSPILKTLCKSTFVLYTAKGGYYYSGLRSTLWSFFCSSAYFLSDWPVKIKAYPGIIICSMDGIPYFNSTLAATSQGR